MVTFVIPVKARIQSTSWRVTSHLLERCLQSIANASAQHFQVLVVGHDAPDFDFASIAAPVSFIEARNPPPPQGAHYSALRGDKCHKLAVGLEAALATDCKLIMKMDADDRVHRDLTGFFETCNADCAAFPSGIVYHTGSAFYMRENLNFYRFCGSSNVFAKRLFEPAHAANAAAHAFFTDDNHQNIFEFAASNGLSIACPDFPAACYIQHTDTSLGRKRIEGAAPNLRMRMGQLRRTRLLTRSVREAFCL